MGAEPRGHRELARQPQLGAGLYPRDQAEAGHTHTRAHTCVHTHTQALALGTQKRGSCADYSLSTLKTAASRKRHSGPGRATSPRLEWQGNQKGATERRHLRLTGARVHKKLARMAGQGLGAQLSSKTSQLKTRRGLWPRRRPSAEDSDGEARCIHLSTTKTMSWSAEPRLQAPGKPPDGTLVVELPGVRAEAIRELLQGQSAQAAQRGWVHSQRPSNHSWASFRTHTKMCNCIGIFLSPTEYDQIKQEKSTRVALG